MSTLTHWRNRVYGTTLYLVARLTSKTASFQLSGAEHFQAALSSGRPTIITAWHGMTMMLAGFLFNRPEISQAVLILPDDWRGDVLEVFARRLGMTPFPMDLSGEASLSAARKLAKLARLMQAGHHGYITPDGPDGPSYVVKPGVAYLARKAQAYILPVGAYTRHGYRQPRWDRYVVPYPFCRISVCFGAPLDVPEEAELTAVTEPLADRLHRVTLQAAANYYEQRPEARTNS